MTFHTLMYLQGDANGGTSTTAARVPPPRGQEVFREVHHGQRHRAEEGAQALALPVAEIAHAIESKDAKFLTELPEIGKRTAETIVAELSGKVKDFVGAIPERAAGALGGAAASVRRRGRRDHGPGRAGRTPRRCGALLDRARQSNAAAKTTQQLVGEMLRMRTVRA
jgi:hypothetical protein